MKITNDDRITIMQYLADNRLETELPISLTIDPIDFPGQIFFSYYAKKRTIHLILFDFTGESSKFQLTTFITQDQIPLVEIAFTLLEQAIEGILTNEL